MESTSAGSMIFPMATTAKGNSRIPLGLVAVILLLAVLRVALAWDALPSRMASHFGASGVADGFMPRDGFMTMMALTCSVPVVLVAVLPPLLRLMPTGLINLPNREYWLSPERREGSLARLVAWLAWFAVPLAAFLALVVELTIRANVTSGGLDMRVFGVGVGLYVAAMAALVISMYRDFRLPASPSS